MPTLLDAHRGLIQSFWLNVDWARTKWGVLSQNLKNRVNYSYADDLNLNASIRFDPNYDLLCVVNMGTALAVWDIYMQIAACAEINGLAKSDYLVAESGHTNQRFTDYNWLLADAPAGGANRSVPQVVPGDLTRLAIGNQFSSLAALFLVLHEEAHYLCGHLYLLDQRGENPHLFENPSSLPTSSDWPKAKFSRKVMEMEADMWALEIMLWGGHDKNVLETTHLGKQMNQDVWNQLVMLSASSMYCAFELAAKRRGITAPESTHPSAGCRWLNLLNAYKVHVEQASGRELHPGELEAIIDNLSIVTKMFDAVPVDIEDVLAALFLGAEPPRGGPGEEYIALHEEANVAVQSAEWNAARSKALESVNVRLPERDFEKESNLRRDFGTRIPLSAFETLRRPKSG
jgi:hypothetical protein